MLAALVEIAAEIAVEIDPVRETGRKIASPEAAGHLHGAPVGLARAAAATMDADGPLAETEADADDPLAEREVDAEGPLAETEADAEGPLAETEADAVPIGRRGSFVQPKRKDSPTPRLVEPSKS